MYSEEEVVEMLAERIDGFGFAMMEDDPDYEDKVAIMGTFASTGLSTMDEGLVIRVGLQEYQITVKERTW